MPFNTNDTTTYRRDVSSQGSTLSTAERKALLEKYLPQSLPSQKQKPQPQRSPKRSRLGHTKRIRPFLRQSFHIFLYLLIQAIFGVYIRLRQVTKSTSHKILSIRHHHHRTPAYIKRDVSALPRLPQHLSVLVTFDALADDGLETLLDEIAELTAWTTAAGIPLLSVYERTGILKSCMSAVQELAHQKLILYYGAPPRTPTIRVCAPNLPTLDPPTHTYLNGSSHSEPEEISSHLDLLLLSETDGRNTLVDLTRTLAEMAQSQKLSTSDITIDLIDAEISATTSIPQSRVSCEPDLLLLFTPTVKLQGYPPWQIRLTEIFCVGDSGADVGLSGRGRTRVEYQGFLRGLWRYSGAEMRLGR